MIIKSIQDGWYGNNKSHVFPWHEIGYYSTFAFEV